MKKLIADRYSGGSTSTNDTNITDEEHEKMDMDNDAPLKALLGLRHMNEQEQEQISSVGGDSSVNDHVRSTGTSSNIEMRTGTTTVPSLGSKTSHPLNSLSNSTPIQHSIQPTRSNNNIVSGSSSGQTSTSTSNAGGGGTLVRRKTSSTKSSIPSGMYAASDIVSDFIHGFDRTRFANNTKWATSFGRSVVGKGYNRHHSEKSVDSGSIQSLNQYDSASASSNSEARKKACHEGTVTMSVDVTAVGESQSTAATHPFHTQLPSHSSLSSHAMQMRYMPSQPADASSLSSVVGKRPFSMGISTTVIGANDDNSKMAGGGSSNRSSSSSLPMMMHQQAAAAGASLTSSSSFQPQHSEGNQLSSMPIMPMNIPLSPPDPVLMSVQPSMPTWTIDELFAFPKAMTDSFNAGDYERINSVLARYVTEDCVLRTPSMASDVVGRESVSHMLFALLDDHPDAVMMWNEATYDSATTTMTARHYFSGTRALQSVHSHLYCPSGISLMQQLDRTTQHLSAIDLNNLQMLETAIMADRSPFLVYYKGVVRMALNGNNMIYRLDCDWKLMSFRACSGGSDP